MHEPDSQNASSSMVSRQYMRGLLTLVLLVGVVSGGAAGALVSGLSNNGSNPVRGADTDITSLEQRFVVEESSTVSVVETASESVVSVIIEKPVSQATGNTISPFFTFPGFEPFFQTPTIPEPQADFEKQEEEYIQVGGGTGFVVTDDGLILTNKHVVSDETARYSVLTKSGDTYEVDVLARDPVNDLAVIKIREEGISLPAVELGDSMSAQIGQTVLAIGNSLAEFDNTVTRGVISGINRRVIASDGFGASETLESVIQTDAAINPGNSGGPLLNLAGQVIGVNTAVSQEGQLIGFAIPINDAVRLIENIQEFGRVVRPYLGVRYMMIDERVQRANNLPVDYGAIILRGSSQEDLAIVPGGPADLAGLEENDIILEVAGEQIGDDRSLVRALSSYRPGDEVILTILRNGSEQEVTVELGEFDVE